MLSRTLDGWRKSGSSLTDSLVTAIHEAVLDGRLRIGDRLPAERRMAEMLQISRGTVVTALAILRAEGWLVTRQGSASTVQLPPQLSERYAPMSVDRPGLPIDLRAAVASAPNKVYTGAVMRALERSGPLLLGDGEPDAGLPELRELVAQRYTAEGIATLPDQILITAGARAALTLLVEHLRPQQDRFGESDLCRRPVGTAAMQRLNITFPGDHRGLEHRSTGNGLRQGGWRDSLLGS
ncbi:GntR family transcriptional regulator [Catellatospora methionotrophica]|uniref:GntR family transcriptional regulator n=1 Tax=Catellatospora methionotrophica TaxID=121620 RepID=UPI0033CC4D5A